MRKLEKLGEFTLLSIEDDAFNQELATATFEDTENINIYQALNGEEGFRLIEEKSVDIILLDLMMPKMNGLEFLEKIKKHPIHSLIPVIVLTSKLEEKTSTYKLGADDFISKPYSPEELKLRVFNHLRVKKFSDLMKNIRQNSDFKNNISYLKEAIDIIDNSQRELLNGLGDIVHGSEYSSKRLGEYARLLGHLYGFNSIEIDNLYYTMSIYDIGLLRIPKEKLITEDSEIFKSHTKLGVEILEGINETTLINMAKKVILYHHENWDGSGYPYGIQGTEIPICAHIASIVDFFDKLTVPRIYTHKTLGSMEAYEVMKRERGTMFNPELLDLFLNNFNKFRDIKDKLR